MACPILIIDSLSTQLFGALLCPRQLPGRRHGHSQRRIVTVALTLVAAQANIVGGRLSLRHPAFAVLKFCLALSSARASAKCERSWMQWTEPRLVWPAGEIPQMGHCDRPLRYDGNTGWMQDGARRR
eukprot:SAG31_NODE_4308_length_3369_cov_2.531804_1_plen_126_part_10